MMNTFSKIAAIAVSIALVATACGGTSHPPAEVGKHVDAVVFSQVASQPGVIILDVRTPAEIAQGHLPGAAFANLEAADFRDRLDTLDRDATYAVYCRSGNRSRAALVVMADMGFANVTGLDGGIIDWVNAGGTVVTP